jgi:hypothetical protein
MAVRSKAYVCGRSPVEIVGSNTFLLCICKVHVIVLYMIYFLEWKLVTFMCNVHLVKCVNVR